MNSKAIVSDYRNKRAVLLGFLICSIAAMMPLLYLLHVGLRMQEELVGQSQTAAERLQGRLSELRLSASIETERQLFSDYIKSRGQITEHTAKAMEHLFKCMAALMIGTLSLIIICLAVTVFQRPFDAASAIQRDK